MTEEQKIRNILINDNAYFFKKKNALPLSATKLSGLFTLVSSIKIGRYLLKRVKESYNSVGKPVEYSICVFKYHTQPTFIEKYVADWDETKIAYLLICEYEDYLIISRKNISNLQDFLKNFTPLPYQVLSTLFIDDDTSFEKFALKNLNVSDKAIREKSMEAVDLKQAFSALGANTYMLSSLRVKNKDTKTSVLFNSSRINKFGKKNNIELFCDWSHTMVDKIKGHVVSETFLSIFAEPQDYSSLRSTLIPISVLFSFGDIYTDFETGRIASVFVRYIMGNTVCEREIDLFKQFSKIEQLNDVTAVGNKFMVENSIADDLELKLNDISITLRSEKLRKVIVRKDNGNEVSILEYINSHHAFIINFDSIDLAYYNRSLFRDNRLLGNIEHFLKIFKPYPALGTVSSEKGTFTTASTSFSVGSQFDFVEGTFSTKHDFLICDDLSREWADHIGINSDRITFYHSKYKTSKSSASAFQDIVGQAQKNLGNLSPQGFRIDEKKDFWKNDYVSAKGDITKIARLRKGSSVEDGTDLFKEALNNPYLSKEVVLVISFISKAQLTGWLEDLKDGIHFNERNEVIQILWFISSLVASCIEVNTEVTIACKP